MEYAASPSRQCSEYAFKQRFLAEEFHLHFADGIQASNGQVLTETKDDINKIPGGRIKTLTDQVKNRDIQDNPDSSDIDCPNNEKVQATDQQKLVPLPDEIDDSFAHRDDGNDSLNSQGNLGKFWFYLCPL